MHDEVNCIVVIAADHASTRFSKDKLKCIVLIKEKLFHHPAVFLVFPAMVPYSMKSLNKHTVLNL